MPVGHFQIRLLSLAPRRPQSEEKPRTLTRDRYTVGRIRVATGG